jgi:hypothetical protein
VAQSERDAGVELERVGATGILGRETAEKDVEGNENKTWVCSIRYANDRASSVS